MAAFGGVSAVVQFVGQLFPEALDPAPVLGGSVLLCVAWAVARGRQPSAVAQDFRRPNMTVSVGCGDLFEERAHLVVGFSDTFDTDVHDGIVISGSSVQGQLLHRRYHGDTVRLDSELGAALRDVTPLARETREDKP
ncbi:MAG: hypothetical protein H5T76_39320, partial [Streptomyces sp.]|nr:hypothetical protein [Streptomyces sp.]